MSPMPTPIVLIDAPEDGVVEEHGHVETTVTEDEARDFLAELCSHLDGELGAPFRPVGPATKVRLAPIHALTDESIDWEQQRWVPASEQDLLLADVDAEDLHDRLAESREFWQVEVSDGTW